MKAFFQKYKIPVVILLLVLLVAGWLFVRPEKQTLLPSPTPTTLTTLPVNTWNGIMPGASLFEDVNKQLGEPVKNDGNVYEYKSANPNINNKVVFEDNVAVLIKRITVIEERLSINNLLSQYGRNYIVLYGELSSFGDNLHVYPDRGIALLGNQYTGRVLEIWYFKPVSSVEEFISKYANDYSLDPEEHGSF